MCKSTEQSLRYQGTNRSSLPADPTPPAPPLPGEVLFPLISQSCATRYEVTRRHRSTGAQSHVPETARDPGRHVLTFHRPLQDRKKSNPSSKVFVSRCSLAPSLCCRTLANCSSFSGNKQRFVPIALGAGERTDVNELLIVALLRSLAGRESRRPTPSTSRRRSVTSSSSTSSRSRREISMPSPAS